MYGPTRLLLRWTYGPRLSEANTSANSAQPKTSLSHVRVTVKAAKKSQGGCTQELPERPEVTLILVRTRKTKLRAGMYSYSGDSS